MAFFGFRHSSANVRNEKRKRGETFDFFFEAANANILGPADPISMRHVADFRLAGNDDGRKKGIGREGKV